MTTTKPLIGLRKGDRTAYEQYRTQRHQQLVGTEDDMWATFADIAEPYALTVNQRTAGRCSVDEDRQLHAFHVDGEFEEIASEILAAAIAMLDITATMPSTVDPAYLSLGLTAGERAEPVALLYEHLAESQATETVDLRLATSADHAAAVAFYHAETGSPEAFLQMFLAERIEKAELYLVEGHNGEIAATGEHRVDTRTPGHAHLGLVVGSGLRAQGLGTKLMHTLVELAKSQTLAPLCSTEPSNPAAQRLIHRTGFRTRHRVFRVATTESGQR